MLKTMLYWLGAIEIGRDKPKRFVSFRVTDEGRALFDPEHQAQSHAHPTKNLLVQPNFEVLVLHPDSKVLWNVIRCADLVRHDRVSVYAITRESIARAAEAGLSADKIKEFLNARTGKGLPQNVSHSIEDWSRQVKRATIRRETLIEVDDPSVLDELSASRKTRKYIAQRLSPNVAIVNLPDISGAARDDPWQRLLKELRGAGYSARVQSSGTESTDHVAPEAGNGRIGKGEPTVAEAGGVEHGTPATRGRGNVSRMRKSADVTATPPRGKTGTH
jgi:hypothetical protein